MSGWEWIRLLLGGALLLGGLLIFLTEMYGVFHLKYVLNRMHAAALGDTLGIGCSMAGLMLLSGFRFSTLKMAMVVIFLWLTSPVASHLLARLEASTNEKLDSHCEIYERLEDLERELEARREQEGQAEQEARREQEGQAEQEAQEGQTERAEQQAVRREETV
ncbi:MAG: monovalent cation/H(+) antiporter subunit G [Muribaculum sp.]|nr:monovalent cation/H(+) antiporter subunit G [Muribaculum sp.]